MSTHDVEERALISAHDGHETDQATTKIEDKKLKKASVSTQLKSVYTTESFESCQYVITRMQICCGMATYSILSRSVQTQCYDKKWDPCKYRISFPALDRTRGLLLDR